MKSTNPMPTLLSPDSSSPEPTTSHTSSCLFCSPFPLQSLFNSLHTGLHLYQSIEKALQISAKLIKHFPVLLLAFSYVDITISLKHSSLGRQDTTCSHPSLGSSLLFSPSGISAPLRASLYTHSSLCLGPSSTSNPLISTSAKASDQCFPYFNVNLIKMQSLAQQVQDRTGESAFLRRFQVMLKQTTRGRHFEQEDKSNVFAGECSVIPPYPPHLMQSNAPNSYSDRTM